MLEGAHGQVAVVRGGGFERVVADAGVFAAHEEHGLRHGFVHFHRVVAGAAEALAQAASVEAVADPHVDRAIAPARWLDAPAVWADPGEPCVSFSRWWSRVTKTPRGDTTRR